MVGTSAEWKQYRTSFAYILAESAGEQNPSMSLNQPGTGSLNGSLNTNGSLKKFFRRLDEAGTPVADRDGALWMEFADGDESFRIGLSANNVFSSGNDADLAHQLVLARVGHVLKSPKHSRESMVEFKKDWSLLQSVRSNRASALAKTAPAAAGLDGSVLSGNE
jgi:hypothetical protein